MMQDGVLVRSHYIRLLDDAQGDTGVIKILTGMRCVGKTVAMRQFAKYYAEKKGYGILDYDFDGNAGLTMRNPYDLRDDILKKCDGNGHTIILLHEFQKIQRWDTILEELIPVNAGEFFLTASDDSVRELGKSKILSKSFVEIRMYPMTLHEFMEFNGIQSSRAALEEYIRIGGLPVVKASLPPETAKIVLDGVFSTALLKDVLPYGRSIASSQAIAVQRHVIVDSGTILDSELISSATGSSFMKSNSIADAMAGCYLIVRNEGRSLLSKLRRSDIVYYAQDAGLRNSLADFVPDRISQCETLMIIELKRLGYSVKIEHNEERKVFVAGDASGKVSYVLYDGLPGKADTASEIHIGIDMKGERNRYTLQTFLLEWYDEPDDGQDDRMQDTPRCRCILRTEVFGFRTISVGTTEAGRSSECRSGIDDRR